ncbi:MAG: hypothetical protein KJ042_01785 [Deltaproteobacteria bacterium]|nr:hypothetical protein [Deltaproteobacteria bacterium]
MTIARPWWIALLLMLAVSACGGGDDSPSSDSGGTGDDDATDDDAADDDATDDDAGDDDTWPPLPDDDADDDADDDDTGPPVDFGALIPGPDEDAFDDALAQKALRYAHVFDDMFAEPFGMSLETYISDPDDREMVDDWMTNSDLGEDFEDYTGTPLYDVIDSYDEFGDLGMFGGMAAMGDVYRYVLARDGDSGDFASIEELRQNVVDLMDALHIAVAITGEPGVVVRGLHPKGLPGGDPATLPLFDGGGDPQPDPKTNTYRDDNSGDYPDWLWIDNTSKDQVDGWILAMGAVWDAVADDPDIDDALKTRLQDDARAIADMLRAVAPETGLDLSLRDADGRLTSFHDLNALELEGVVFPEFLGLGNGFNAVMSLGFIKTLAFITGDADLMDYWDELYFDRDYPRYVDQTFRITMTGPFTNWSNANMAFCAIYPLLRYEADPAIRAYWQEVLRRDLWETWFGGWGAADTDLAWFTVIYSAFAPGGTDVAAADAAAEDLAGFPEAPYWNEAIINCDPSELAAGECLAVDGVTTITLAGAHIGGTFYPYLGHNDAYNSVDPIPRAIRPPSNFNWRSNPFEPNGGGGSRLNPGGDFHGAYWLGRYLRRASDAALNVAEYAW